MLNGDGLRVVLWVAGCNHCCRECQNPITWDPDGGLLFDEAAKQEIFEQLEKPYISGITFSGGDPMHPVNRADVRELMQEIREKYPTKTIPAPGKLNSFVKFSHKNTEPAYKADSASIPVYFIFFSTHQPVFAFPLLHFL